MAGSSRAGSLNAALARLIVNAKVPAHLTVWLASASPGGRGGARSVALVREWLGNMSVNVAEHSLSIATAHFDDEGNLAGTGLDGLDQFVAQVGSSTPRRSGA